MTIKIKPLFDVMSSDARNNRYAIQYVYDNEVLQSIIIDGEQLKEFFHEYELWYITNGF